MSDTTDKIIKTTFKLKRAYQDVWETLNPILQDGEPGYNKTNNKLKIGNGTSPWMDLEYLVDDYVTKIILSDNELIPDDEGAITLPTADVGKLGVVSISDDLTTPLAAADAKVVGDRFIPIETKISGIEAGAQVNKIESVVAKEGTKLDVVTDSDTKAVTIDDSALQELIGENKSNIESLTTEVGKKALASDVTALSGRVDTNAQEITAIKLVDTQQTSDIQALQLAVNGAEDVEGLVTKVAKNTSDIASLTDTVGGNTTAIGTIESKVKTIEETTIPAISSRIDGIVDTTIPDVQQSITELSGTVSGIDTEVKAVANDLATLNIEDLNQVDYVIFNANF